MKKLLLLILLFTSSLIAVAQHIENFEGQTNNATDFTTDGQLFTITNQQSYMRIQGNYPNTGWNGTAKDNKYIDNSNYTSTSQGFIFTISSTPGFRLSSMWLYVSTSSLNLSPVGTMTITGKLNGVTQFTLTKSNPFNPSASTNNGFTLFNFANFFGSGTDVTGINIDAVVISSDSGIGYLSLDAFRWNDKLVAPTVATGAVSTIGTTSATLTSTLSKPGNPSLSQYGVVYGTSADPTISGSKVVQGTSASIGDYSTIITGLTPGVTYYARPYATNTVGTAYGASTSFTTLKQTQTLAFTTTAVITYGDADFAPATSSTGNTISYSSSNTNVATIVGGKVHIVSPGTVNITASQAGDANTLPATDVVQSFTVNKANLTITAAAKTKVYGDADPAFTYTTTGVVGTDAPTGSLSRVTPTTTNRFVGTYAIDQGTLTYGNNYNVTYVGANLTITKRPLIIAPLPVTKKYGDVDFAQGAPYSFSGTSIAVGEGMSGPFSRTPASENVGTYALTIGLKHPLDPSTGEDRSANYDISFVTNTFTITPKPVTVNARAQTKTYGDADPAFTYNDSGLAYSDSFTGALTRVPGEGFGTYAISKGTLALSSNYTLTFTGSDLTIGKKTVNVTADANTKAYGDSDPALTYTADALASGDSFTGALTRAAGENFGTYAISQGSLALTSNYTLNFTGANLIVNKKIINVTADAKTKAYGDSDPALTYTADALIGSDTFTGAIARSPGETAGTYNIGQGTLILGGNYDINYTAANFNIGKRAIDIYSGSRDVQYGEPDGTIGYSYSGTPLAGDAFSGALSREPGTALGTYATTIGDFQISNGSNYDLIFHSGQFNIVQREIKVTGGSTFKIYGDADPAINYSIVSGTLLGGTQITGALARDAGETAGPYNVGQGTLAINDANYKLTFQGGYFEIDRAPLTFTIDNKTKVATKPNPALTYSVSGLKNGDTEATAFTAPINLITDANINSGAGDYNIYPVGGAFAINYDVTTVGGTMTVTPASSINTLAGATVNGGVFETAFDPATEFYSVSVPNGSTSATLIATVTSPLSTLSVGAYPAIATPIASGAPYTINFSYGNTEQVGVHVTAEDGSIKSYYFNVTPIPSDSKLSNLITDVGIIAPSFNPNVNFYTLDVPAETEFLTITPTTHDPLAAARVSGGEEGGATGAKTIAVREGGSTTSVNVRSADGTSSTFYSLYIKRPIRLASLTLSAGTLFPAFDPNVDTYTAKVNSAIPSITVTPKGNQSYFTTLVNGDYVNYGDASAPVTINEDGSTTIVVKITAGDGETSKTYTINVVHASSNADLAGIGLSAGALSPVFDPATLTYNVDLPNAQASIGITPALADAGATMAINGSPIANGVTASYNGLNVGIHNYNLTVTAADGSTAKTYALTVNRAPSAESGVASLTLSSGTLSPAFDPAASTHYATTVAYEISELTMTPALADADATLVVKVNGNTIAPYSGAYLLPLNLGDNAVSITGTAQDGTTLSIYTITVTRAKSSVATLSQLAISSVTLSPAFASGVTDYIAAVSNATTTITVTPTVTDAGANVKVNGVAVASGSPSAGIPLLAGANNVTVEVTAADGVATRIYTVTITRALSSIATLSNLRSSAGTLTAVAGASRAYAVSVANNTNTATITAVPADAGASITVNGLPVAANTASQPIALVPGANTATVLVTAADGVATRTYTVTITRALSNIATLSALRSSAGQLTAVAGNNYGYTASVANNTTTATITAVPADAGASITVNGLPVAANTASQPIALVPGANTATVLVTAADGVATRTYTVTITRALSNIATLTALRSSAGTLTAVAGNSYGYTASVANNTTTATITAVPADAGASITVNGVPVAANTASQPIALVPGANTATVLVTAADGVATRTYTVTITRALYANIATLSALRSSAGKLTAVAGANREYTVSVGATVNTATVTAVPADANASITVNGVPVAANVASQPIALNTGPNTVSVIVLAEDGVATRTYTVTITKASPPVIAAIPTKQTDIGIIQRTDASLKASPEDFIVKQALSPNGDGVNDRLTIDGIDLFPNNTVRIMNRNGDVIYQAKGYDNLGQSFDGHSSKGTMQQPGTYFYSIEYKKGAETIRKTGYIVLKY